MIYTDTLTNSAIGLAEESSTSYSLKNPRINYYQF